MDGLFQENASYKWMIWGYPHEQKNNQPKKRGRDLP